MKKYIFLPAICLLWACISGSDEKQEQRRAERNSATEADAAVHEETTGKKLFMSNCAACHAVNDKLIGPALAGVNEKYPEEWLLKFIKNSQELIRSGDPMAVKIYKENNKLVMTSFEHLKDEEIKDILTYIKSEEKK
jgi:mono/diheme cytochrome c family protein